MMTDIEALRENLYLGTQGHYSANKLLMEYAIYRCLDGKREMRGGYANKRDARYMLAMLLIQLNLYVNYSDNGIGKNGELTKEYVDGIEKCVRYSALRGLPPANTLVFKSSIRESGYHGYIDIAFVVHSKADGEVLYKNSMKLKVSKDVAEMARDVGFCYMNFLNTFAEMSPTFAVIPPSGNFEQEVAIAVEEFKEVLTRDIMVKLAEYTNVNEK